jgi:hypothetical protein
MPLIILLPPFGDLLVGDAAGFAKPPLADGEFSSAPPKASPNMGVNDTKTELAACRHGNGSADGRGRCQNGVKWRGNYLPLLHCRSPSLVAATLSSVPTLRRTSRPWHTKALIRHERVISNVPKANIRARVISFGKGCAASMNSRPANTTKLE